MTIYARNLSPNNSGVEVGMLGWNFSYWTRWQVIFDKFQILCFPSNDSSQLIGTRLSSHELKSFQHHKHIFLAFQPPRKKGNVINGAFLQLGSRNIISTALHFMEFPSCVGNVILASAILCIQICSWGSEAGAQIQLWGSTLCGVSMTCAELHA